MDHRLGKTLIGLIFLPAMVLAAHPVDELAYLTAPPEKAESLGFRLTECPMAQASPIQIDGSRAKKSETLLRGMDGQIWEWRNYRVLGSDAICVVLLRPMQEPLTRTRAAILTMVMHNVLPDGSVNSEEVLPWESEVAAFDRMPSTSETPIVDEERYLREQSEAVERTTKVPVIDAAD